MTSWTRIPVPARSMLQDLWSDGPPPRCLRRGRPSYYKAKDGGGSWEQLISGFQGSLGTMARPWPDALLIPGYLRGKPGVLLRLDDKGVVSRFVAGRAPLRGGLFSVAGLGDELHLCGSSGLWSSQDAGLHFLQGTPPLPSLPALALIEPGRVVAAGYDQLYVSTDSGRTWSKKLHEVTAHLCGADGDRARGVYVVGACDLLSSEDGGDTWAHRFHQPAADWSAVLAPGPGLVFLAGADGQIAYSEDGGRTFTREESGVFFAAGPASPLRRDALRAWGE